MIFQILCASCNPTSPAPQSTNGSFKKNSFKKYQNYKPHGTQIVTRNLQNGPPKPSKWRPKPSKTEPKLGQEGARMTKKSKNNIDPTKREELPTPAVHFGGRCGQLCPKLDPKMEPKWRKIDAKIDHKFEAFQDRSLKRFWWILGGKMEASWHPNRIPNRSYLKNAPKQKVLRNPIEFQ